MCNPFKKTTSLSREKICQNVVECDEGDERTLLRKVKAAGGVWDVRQNDRKLADKQVVALGLMDRVVSEGNENEAG